MITEVESAVAIFEVLLNVGWYEASEYDKVLFQQSHCMLVQDIRQSAKSLFTAAGLMNVLEDLSVAEQSTVGPN